MKWNPDKQVCHRFNRDNLFLQEHRSRFLANEDSAFDDDTWRILSEWAKRSDYQQVKVPPLSHYTDAVGLVGICSSNALWATCAQYSNDRSEVIYAQALADVVCRQFFNRTVNPAGEKFKQLVLSLLSKDAIARTNAFLTSFSEASDLLSQWRAYGRNAGFEIRLEPLTAPNESVGGAEVLILHNPLAGRELLVKVSYDRHDQQAKLETILDRGLKLAKEFAPRSDQTPLVVATLCSLEITTWLHTAKHPKLQEEQEWRVIIFPKEKPASSAERLRAAFMGREIPFRYERPEHLRFRTGSQYYVVPYCELVPADRKLPIKEVICGPGGHDVLTAKAVRMLLESKGFSGVVVRNSDVPLIH